MRKIFKKVKKPKEEKQKPESRDVRQTPAEDPLPSPPVDYALRQAFYGSEPWSQSRYEDYCYRSPAGAYFTAPSYEEYLKLFEKYKGRSSYSNYYIENMM